MHYYSFMNIFLCFHLRLTLILLCVFLSFSFYLFPFSRFSASILFHVFANNEKKGCRNNLQSEIAKIICEVVNKTIIRVHFTRK